MKGLRKRRVFKSSLEELLKDIMDNVEGVKAAQLTADTGQPLASILYHKNFIRAFLIGFFSKSKELKSCIVNTDLQPIKASIQ